MDAENLPLRTVVRHYEVALTSEGYSPRTIETNTSVLRSFVRFATNGREPVLADLTVERAREYVAYLQTEHFKFDGHRFAPKGGRLSDYTLNLHGRVLRAFAGWLQREGYTAEHILARFRPLRPTTKEIVPLTAEEFARLVAALHGPKVLVARGRAMLFVLFDTGLRASEVANIRMEDIDLETGVLRVQGKGSWRQRVAWRTVGMGTKCLRAIQRYVYQHRSQPVPAREDRLFLTNEGRPMNRNSIHRFIKRLGRRAGVPRAHPHLFRHTFGVGYLRAGGPEANLQKILGHSSRQMVDHYMHLADADVTKLHRRHSPL
jgi:site-specific recombinase XerD